MSTVMSADLPRTYRIVREGQPLEVSAATAETLVDLRTELEIVTRFGAGATPELLAAFDRRLEALAAAGASAERLEAVREMRWILSDAIEPDNRDAIRQMDIENPQLQTGMNMGSIENDAKAFRNDVSTEAGQMGNDDIDAMLAEFEQAANESQADEQSAAPADADVADLTASEDEDIDKLLAEVGAAADGAPAPEPDDPVEAAMAELAESAQSAEPAESSEAAGDDVAAVINGVGAPAGVVSQADVTDEADPVAQFDELSELADELGAASNEDAGEQADGGEAVASVEAAGPTEAVDANQQTDDIAENAAEQVAATLAGAEEQLDAIASAFETAAAELGEVTGEVQEFVAADVREDASAAAFDDVAGSESAVAAGEPGPNAEDISGQCDENTAAEDTVARDAAAENPDADHAAAAPPANAAFDEEVDLAALANWDAETDPPSATSSVQVSVQQPSADPRMVQPEFRSAAATTSGPQSPSALRSQIQDARTSILRQLDDLLVLVERVDRAQAQANQSLEQARQFEQAAARAREAGQMLAEAEAQASKAEAAYAKSQAQVAAARQAWEQAQQQVAATGSGVSS